MVLPKSRNAVGLGNSLMNDRFGKGKASDRKKVSYNAAAIRRTGPGGETYITNPTEEASWVKMRSITEQAALDEFLSTAELAGTDFTAEKMNNVKIIHPDQKNPYLLSAADERTAVSKHQRNKNRLTVPRRPKWNSKTTRQQLDIMERENFIEWRRGLAELQENQDLLMTPFERNIEVWRQLWRVIERSDLIVQIVDARNPLLFRSEDLEKYVKEVDPKKRNLLLVNKADMMTPHQRELWADFFESQGISYKFFSAALAKEQNEAKLDEGVEDDASVVANLVKRTSKAALDDSEGNSEDDDSETDESGGIPLPADPSESRIRILSVDELESLFLEAAPTPDPQIDGSESSKKVTTIGLVGYPNVGKSSTINALLGAKKVSVSATPGKTKHFQTLHLSPTLVLCDCPGLVFPNFATTKAELVINGVLPIDQLREYTGPAGLVAQRIPKHFLEAIYGMKIHTRPIEEGGTGIPTSSEVLRGYARARGFATTGQGQPDESRAARYILKDYVNGKLLYCHPPPPIADSVPLDPTQFNQGLYDLAHLPPKRQAALLNQSSSASVSGFTDSNDVDTNSDVMSLSSAQPPFEGARSRNIDAGFFTAGGSGSAGHLKMPFNHVYTEQGAKQRHKELSGRKARTMIALEKGVDVSEVQTSGKKHFKGGKRKAKAKGNTKDADDF
ncbi:hypothetical protein D8B26_005809 [Coccidioides posadasii str. Silveira]|uniref:Ribosome biogenesis GTPase Lsg1 n=2 Tax=Coccidioides posadasii TaxID=199306 RepID=E9DAZ9_COCPS|nr:GTPase family protein [Coccidioides posadasii C735 delta SOWgp]EER27256.1 GTPase family protein [Coccidioides posadasii C735 delta SOWgp]EFW16485.1 ribosome biogenesis GTPase Lsg1 [Coccidioides posadasii str. Silveira]QVM11158.1 hypothetical protein D8B26_005809 [Coccidioides posadasii str. Silveira]|eukprot:XP_003069401.1 GTPase family protein [Coccidioides posadasii C735 delta SOWgp]